MLAVILVIATPLVLGPAVGNVFYNVVESEWPSWSRLPAAEDRPQAAPYPDMAGRFMMKEQKCKIFNRPQKGKQSGEKDGIHYK